MGFFDSDDRMWDVVSVGSAALAAIAVRGVLKRGWKRWTGEEAPVNPVEPRVDWRHALVWAGTTGAAVAVARVLARRGAAAGWKRVTGRTPPV